MVSISLDTYKEAFDNAPIGMAIVSPDGRWLVVNKTLCNIVGFREDELLNMTFQDITHKDDLNKDLEYVNKMLDKKIDKYQMEKRYIHKDGHEVWILLSATLVWEGDNPKYFISQIQDIEETKAFEKSLQNKIRQVERLNEVMVGREVKMRDLKKELSDLKKTK